MIIFGIYGYSFQKCYCVFSCTPCHKSSRYNISERSSPFLTPYQDVPSNHHQWLSSSLTLCFLLIYQHYAFLENSCDRSKINKSLLDPDLPQLLHEFLHHLQSKIYPQDSLHSTLTDFQAKLSTFNSSVVEHILNSSPYPSLTSLTLFLPSSIA